jgi:hypothetical protein
MDTRGLVLVIGHGSYGAIGSGGVGYDGMDFCTFFVSIKLLDGCVNAMSCWILEKDCCTGRATRSHGWLKACHCRFCQDAVMNQDLVWIA